MQVILKDLSVNMELSEKSAHFKQRGEVKKQAFQKMCTQIVMDV